MGDNWKTDPQAHQLVEEGHAFAKKLNPQPVFLQHSMDF